MGLWQFLARTARGRGTTDAAKKRASDFEGLAESHYPFGPEHELMRERGRLFLGLSPRQAASTGDGGASSAESKGRDVSAAAAASLLFASDSGAASHFASFDPERESPLAPSFAEAGGGGEEPDGDRDPDARSLQRVEDALDAVERQFEKIIARLDAQLTLRRRRARDIIRMVEAWFERQANTPRQAS